MSNVLFIEFISHDYTQPRPREDVKTPTQHHRPLGWQGS